MERIPPVPPSQLNLYGIDKDPTEVQALDDLGSDVYFGFTGTCYDNHKMLWFLYAIYENLGAKSLDLALSGSSDVYEKMYAQEANKCKTIEKMHGDYKEACEKFGETIESSTARLLKSKEEHIASLLVTVDTLNAQVDSQRQTIDELRERLTSIEKIMQAEYEGRQVYKRQVSAESNAKKVARLARVNVLVREITHEPYWGSPSTK
jgi:uncharacterized coiled-coil protein SlyX